MHYLHIKSTHISTFLFPFISTDLSETLQAGPNLCAPSVTPGCGAILFGSGTQGAINFSITRLSATILLHFVEVKLILIY